LRRSCPQICGFCFAWPRLEGDLLDSETPSCLEVVGTAPYTAECMSSEAFAAADGRSTASFRLPASKTPPNRPYPRYTRVSSLMGVSRRVVKELSARSRVFFRRFVKVRPGRAMPVGTCLHACKVCARSRRGPCGRKVSCACDQRFAKAQTRSGGSKCLHKC